MYLVIFFGLAMLLIVCWPSFSLQDFSQEQRSLSEVHQMIDIKARQEQAKFCQQMQKRLKAKYSRGVPLVPSTAKQVPSLFHGKRSYWMELYPKGDIVSDELIKSGIWDEGNLRRAVNYFEMYSRKHNIPLSNLTFVDVGAHVGAYTFRLADLGVNVIAIEPMPQNVQLLRRALCRNPQFANRVVIHPVGLSGKARSGCRIIYSNINIGNGHLKCGNSTTTHLERREADSIKLVRVDDILGQTLENHRHIVFLKMDVEGFEGQVVEGGPVLFGSGRIPLIQTEYHPEWIDSKGSSSKNMLSTLFLAGYRMRQETSPDGDPKFFLTEAEARNLSGLNNVLFETSLK